MVTHEQDIAAYARRNVTMRDGVILEDRPVARRADATSELVRIQDAEAPPA
jgi:ABC-type lipoprotein export system ATPase subunit